MTKEKKPLTAEDWEHKRQQLHEASQRITRVDTGGPISERSWRAYQERLGVEQPERPELDPEILETIRTKGTRAINALPERLKNELDAFLAYYADTHPEDADDIRYFRDLLDPDSGFGRIDLSPEDVVRLLEIVEGE